MTLYTTLILDEEHDLLSGTHPTGETTVIAGFGKLQVAQAVAQNVALRKGSVWWNRSVGVDYESLFFNTTYTDEEMEPMRAQALREAILNTVGVRGFVADDQITFERVNNTLKPTIPCVIIDCENSLSSTEVEVL